MCEIYDSVSVNYNEVKSFSGFYLFSGWNITYYLISHVFIGILVKIGVYIITYEYIVLYLFMMIRY